MRNVYLIVSDTHFSYREKDNRFSYYCETLVVKKKIIDLCMMYKLQGSKVHILFLGDIYDNSFKDSDMALIEFDTMTHIRSLVESIVSVIGNHELSYQKDNPFWSLVSSVDVNSVNLPRKRFKAKGISGVIKIMDKLEDGEVVFHFNHYSANVSSPDLGKINIGLFHQEITCSPAVTGAVNRGLDVFETSSIKLEDNDVISGYKYSFFGHFHKYYGKWSIDNDRFIYYLASHGRPNHSEVDDSFLERNIPAVVVEDGKFVEVIDNKYNLPMRAQSVKEDVVVDQKKKREKRKELMKVVDVTSCNSDVMTGVKQKLGNEVYDYIIDCMVNDVPDSLFDEIKRRNLI